MIETDKPDSFLDVDECAAYLRISKVYVYQLKARKKIPYHKVGGRILFSRNEITDYIKANEEI